MMSTEIPSVNSAQAAKLSGLSPTMITYLSRIDVLKASSHDAPRRGKRRQFTFADVLYLRVITELLDKGIEVKRLGAALQKAKADTETWIHIARSPHRYLVTDGTELFIRNEGQLESKTFNGQFAFAFVIDLKEAQKRLSDEWPEKKAA